MKIKGFEITARLGDKLHIIGFNDDIEFVMKDGQVIRGLCAGIQLTSEDEWLINLKIDDSGFITSILSSKVEKIMYMDWHDEGEVISSKELRKQLDSIPEDEEFIIDVPFASEGEDDGE